VCDGPRAHADSAHFFQPVQGWEIVDNTARLCVMNLYLHGISLIHVADSLAEDPGVRFPLAITNPPLARTGIGGFAQPAGYAGLVFSVRISVFSSIGRVSPC